MNRKHIALACSVSLQLANLLDFLQFQFYFYIICKCILIYETKKTFLSTSFYYQFYLLMDLWRDQPTESMNRCSAVQPKFTSFVGLATAHCAVQKTESSVNSMNQVQFNLHKTMVDYLKRYNFQRLFKKKRAIFVIEKDFVPSHKTEVSPLCVIELRVRVFIRVLHT